MPLERWFKCGAGHWLGECENIGRFWRIFNNIPQPSQYFSSQKTRRKQVAGRDVEGWGFFRQGVRPEWEDRANVGGVVISWFVQTGESTDASWTELALALVGADPGFQDVNGIRVLDRTKKAKIEIWVSRNGDKESIRAAVLQVLQIAVDPKEATPRFRDSDIPVPPGFCESDLSVRDVSNIKAKLSKVTTETLASIAPELLASVVAAGPEGMAVAVQTMHRCALDGAQFGGLYAKIAGELKEVDGLVGALLALCWAAFDQLHEAQFKQAQANLVLIAELLSNGLESSAIVLRALAQLLEHNFEERPEIGVEAWCVLLGAARAALEDQAVDELGKHLAHAANSLRQREDLSMRVQFMIQALLPSVELEWRAAAGMDPDAPLGTPIDHFEKMQLHPSVLQGVYEYGWELPSPVQQRAIVPMGSGKDLIVQAHAGGGKTGAFVIGILQRINVHKKSTQAMVLANTKELADQICLVLRCVGERLGVRTSLQIGGTKYAHNKDAHVVVGTPGRVLDMVHKDWVQVSSMRVLVIDEADEMLENDKIRAQVQSIATRVYKESSSTQTCLFSATMPQECLAIAAEFLREPLHLLLPREHVTVAGISQFYVDCERSSLKLVTLTDLLELLPVAQTVIFVNSQKSCEQLEEMLIQSKFSVSALHGGMEAAERQQRMKDFRAGHSRVMIGTDLIARGIDVQQISVVINYDLPLGPQGREQYVHRIGRGGRMGRRGVALNLVTNEDRHLIQEIADFWSCEIKECPMDLASLI
eukprot:TRINITY_DN4664_c0_g1_i1.p1 TRINITY_DN4664_c0_g1~~TRINITY_DN4664_c0_g1_i1.p1  ORF type:complete len:761 (-),score=219.41 TRINITY_DN4664_c0_g1_i1:142-2424(-)